VTLASLSSSFTEAVTTITDRELSDSSGTILIFAAYTKQNSSLLTEQLNYLFLILWPATQQVFQNKPI
jgi:hypothetical protein